MDFDKYENLVKSSTPEEWTTIHNHEAEPGSIFGFEVMLTEAGGHINGVNWHKTCHVFRQQLGICILHSYPHSYPGWEFIGASCPDKTVQRYLMDFMYFGNLIWR